MAICTKVWYCFCAKVTTKIVNLRKGAVLRVKSGTMIDNFLPVGLRVLDFCAGGGADIAVDIDDVDAVADVNFAKMGAAEVIDFLL